MGSLTDKIKKALRITGQKLTTDIKQELTDQGHVHTGKLLKSVKFNVNETSDINLDVEMLDYHQFVEHGVKATRIPFGGKRTGKKRSKYIEALIAYFKAKGKALKEAKAAAFATAHKHKEEGMPTKASKAYSKNNRRLDFIKESTQTNPTIEEAENLILDSIESEANLILDHFEKNIR